MFAPKTERIQLLAKKHVATVAHDYHHILKSLTYFDDTKDDPAPELNFKASWDEVRNYFKTEIPKITKIILNLG
ncbi:MAG: hypothetical protein WA093_00945 [Minisyncoccales bacterium]